MNMIKRKRMLNQMKILKMKKYSRYEHLKTYWMELTDKILQKERSVNLKTGPQKSSRAPRPGGHMNPGVSAGS